MIFICKKKKENIREVFEIYCLAKRVLGGKAFNFFEEIYSGHSQLLS